LAVVAPDVAQRLQAARSLDQALSSEPMLAYSFELPLIEQWLLANDLQRNPLSPALIGQDLRTLRNLIIGGFGWSVLPMYLCADVLQRRTVVEIPSPVSRTTLSYHLVWSPSALRNPERAQHEMSRRAA